MTCCLKTFCFRLVASEAEVCAAAQVRVAEAEELVAEAEERVAEAEERVAEAEERVAEAEAGRQRSAGR